MIRDDIQKKLLPFVEKPLRYSGGEINVVHKNLSDVTVHGCVCFPDVYEIGMSHHGLQILYHIVNSYERWALSRCFHPWTDAEDVMRREGIGLFTLEYHTPVKEADWIGFSAQYELQYTNLVNMIDMAGLKVLSSERGDDDPLIIAGGPCMMNPEPLTQFVDAFLIGDGEEAVVEFCEVIQKFKGSGRKNILNEVAKIKGFYVPSLYSYYNISTGIKCRPHTARRLHAGVRPPDGIGAAFNSLNNSGIFVVPDISDKEIIKPARIKSFQKHYLPAAPIVPLMDVVHHRLSAEVLRGCVRGCRFCGAGMYYRPTREKSVGLICDQLSDGVRSTGWREAGLLSLSTADHSRFGELLEALRSLKHSRNMKMTLPSTRIDALTGGQLDTLRAVTPLSSMTVAPEAGSERLRRAINKDFSDEAVYNTVNLLLEHGAQTIKLYFMIGLPTETEADIQAIIDMTRNISNTMRKKSPRLALHVSASPFSPKPNTPFQWEGMENPDALNEKGRRIKRELRNCKNVKASYRDGWMAFLETAMARGDRKMGDVILAAWRAGARFDGWDEMFNIDRWMNAAESVGVDLGIYINPVGYEEPLPWQAISVGVDVDFLKRERERAMRGETTADCRDTKCQECGACGDGVAIQLDTLDDKSARLDTLSTTMSTTSVLSSAISTTSTIPSPPPSSPQKTHSEFGRKPRIAGKSSSSLRYRLYYEKLASVRFLGHLDMVGVIIRAMTAAGIPLAYSEGFNPHPRASFGPPLPFGATGINEAFDIETTAPLTGDILRINDYLPNGLRIKSCKPIEGKASLTSSITASRYHISPPKKITAGMIEDALSRLTSLQEIVVTREKNGKRVDKDIRPAIINAECGMRNAELIIETILSLTPQSCKPSEFIAALFPGENLTEFEICRAEYIGE